MVSSVMKQDGPDLKVIAHARIKTDKIDAGVLAQLHTSGFLPEVWGPDERTERLRRLVTRWNQVVRRHTPAKNEVYVILQAHLVPKCRHADLFNNRRRAKSSRDDRRSVDRCPTRPPRPHRLGPASVARPPSPAG